MSAATIEQYTATVGTDPAAAIAQWARWSENGAITGLFQTPAWLDAWYATLGCQPGRQPLFATIARRSDGRVLMALPLLQHRSGGLRRVEFADLGVTDYTAPLFSPDCPDDPPRVRAMFRALRRALPPADLFCIHKMSSTVGGRANPLMQLSGVRPSPLFGNLVVVGEDFDAWRFSREKTHRKELERSWRVFTRHPEAGFRLITDVSEAMHVMAALERYQREAIANKGWIYILDEPGYRDFYHRLIATGLASGDTVVSALTAGEEVVGALLGVRRGDHYAMIRIGNAGGEWRNCSPGRLVIERTMAALHAQGVRYFDFTIGDYPYKKGFQPSDLPLAEAAFALSWRGLPHARSSHLKHALRSRLKPHIERWRNRRSAVATDPGA